MSDVLAVRGIDRETAEHAIRGWQADGRRLGGAVTLRDVWEPLELFVHGRNALWCIHRNRHARELAAVVLAVRAAGGRVVRVMLHRGSGPPPVEDLTPWAEAVAAGDG